MAGARRADRKAPQRLILDSGAVIGLARGDHRARAFLARALEMDTSIEIPVVVVAETIRGGPRDAPINRILKSIGSVPEAGEAHGRTAGRLLGAARSASTIDALVVAHAVEAGGGQILTGDPGDLAQLAAPHPEVWIQSL